LPLSYACSLPPRPRPKICPLKTAARLARALPALRGLPDDDVIDRLAGTPVNTGGALILLASDSAAEAAEIQKNICNTLLYPKLNCRFNASSDPLGPLYYHLDDKHGVQEWIATKATPLALAPVGAGLVLAPDALCKVPVDSLLKMPASVKYQLVCRGGEAGGLQGASRGGAERQECRGRGSRRALRPCGWPGVVAHSAGPPPPRRALRGEDESSFGAAGLAAGAPAQPAHPPGPLPPPALPPVSV
jgi:hypothetical protein